jgi:hypothetical protein
MTIFLVISVALAVAFAFGYWYRGWKHNLDIFDDSGETTG